MPANAESFTRESLTKIAVELTQEEFKHHKRHYAIRFSVGMRERNWLTRVEHCKLSDWLLDKYGLDRTQLN